jgi:N-acetylmuramic acid 6-phosphate etherase
LSESDRFDIPTEAANTCTRDIDLLTPLEILRTLNQQDQQVAHCVEAVLPAMAAAVEIMIDRLRAGGSVHYFGAGTSGRLGMLDAAEMPPTFGLAPTTFAAHQAGGQRAAVRANEGAEDDEADGASEASILTNRDVAVGIAASGITPYVAGALREARRRGSASILISSNPGASLGSEVDVHIAPDTGAESITGSTRMKAGTAAKLILNGMSTTAMIAIGRTYSHFMVSMNATNTKLRRRAIRILEETTGRPADACAAVLDEAGLELETALTMILAGVDPGHARTALVNAGGVVRAAVATLQ